MITINQISNYTTLSNAFKTVSRKSKVAGLDGITSMDFGSDADRNLKELSWAIKAGVYEPSDLKTWEMEKKGKVRHMGILTCTDRIVATAFANALVKTVNSGFIDNCFAYRQEKSALEAVSVAASYIQGGYDYCARLDIAEFFDSIDHKVLFEILNPLFDDETYNLITHFIQRSENRNGKGIVLGSPLSPVLSNIYLMSMDTLIQEKSDSIYIRYADDILLLAHSKNDIEKAIELITEVLHEKKLELNSEKSYIRNVAEGFQFLGFNIDSEGIKASDGAEEALEEMLNNEWQQNKNVVRSVRLDSLLKRFNGWKGYYRDAVTGGLLGVVALIYEGKTDDEQIMKYRLTLNFDND